MLLGISQDWLLQHCWARTTDTTLSLINEWADFNRQPRYNPKSNLLTLGYNVALPTTGYRSPVVTLPENDFNPYLSPNRSTVVNSSPKLHWNLLIPPQNVESRIVPINAMNTMTAQLTPREPVAAMTLEQRRIATLEGLNWTDLADKLMQAGGSSQDKKKGRQKYEKKVHIGNDSALIDMFIRLGWGDANMRNKGSVDTLKLLTKLFEYKAKYDELRRQQGLPPLQ